MSRHFKPRRPSPALAVGLLALAVAVAGVTNGSLGAQATAGAPATAAKAIDTKRVKLRSASVLVPVGTPLNGNWNSRAVDVKCKRGETAIATGTKFSDDRDNLEFATVFNRLTVDKRGRPVGARARGATDITDVGFTVYVVCVS